MDPALHPRFAQNRTIYFTYSKPGERGDTTTLASARFEGGTVSAVRDLFVADAWSTAGGNSGSRIAFGLDGTIYMTVGERHEQTPAQDLRTHKGKILRLNDDGTVPPDNPFVGRADARPEIFAYGVRNPQGLFIEPSSGTIWEHEHGPRRRRRAQLSSPADTTTDGPRSRLASTTTGRRSPTIPHAPEWISP
ncbi:MAG TPA: PQQ-dependent sugar dehydrogenase [Vicinamibacterales bacterium]|nr:PQQ-dependent sugar dehydrogenase [Vicinamibacterales bacterium]